MEFKSERAQEADPALVPFWSLRKNQVSTSWYDIRTRLYRESALKDAKNRMVSVSPHHSVLPI